MSFSSTKRLKDAPGSSCVFSILALELVISSRSPGSYVAFLFSFFIFLKKSLNHFKVCWFSIVKYCYGLNICVASHPQVHMLKA